MFIVAMTLAVIAAMGVYALQIASTEVKTAGFVRQQIQTQYLSQYGTGAMTQALTYNAQTYASVMMQQPDQFCYSLFQISTQPTANAQSQACHRAMSAELGTQVVQGGAPAQLLSAPAAYSPTSDLTRGQLGLPIAPEFFVEVTDPYQRQPPPGYSNNSSTTICFKEVTASAMGMTPTTVIANANDSTAFLSEGLEMSRARIEFGPVRCDGTN
jgi:hypothetical protein